MEAAGLRDPVRPGAGPAPRAVPKPRVTPAPRIGPNPRLRSNGGTGGVGANPGLGHPQIQGRECYARCGSQCQTMSCADLDVSECTALRQRCRMNCRSGCR